MIFNSLLFIFFFIAVVSTFFLVPHRWRWLLLLVASCYFYMVFKPEYILILFFTIIIDYLAGIIIEKSTGSSRKFWLIISLVSNIGILAVFKYFNFFTGNLNGLIGFITGNTGTLPDLNHFLNWGMEVILPIGLSFHTFQAMSYTIEVYRGKFPAEKHFGIYALYVMFFPQLVAGPIERPQNVLPQFWQKKEYNFENLKAGLMQMAWGFFKKVVVADRLAIYVDAAYKSGQIHEQSGSTMLLAAFFYSFQIYCDFSGYSDIAIGGAKVMGYNLMENFKTPYFAASISDFWRRWHISLSTWFKDYVYIPLGGNRISAFRTYINTFIIFLLSGFWHGNTWNFVVWGGLHGIYLILGQLKSRYMGNILPEEKYRIWHNFSTFTLVMFAWVFFRAKNFSDSKAVFSSIFSGKLFEPIAMHMNLNHLLFSFLVIGILCLKEKYYYLINTKSDFKFYSFLLGFIIVNYFFGVFNKEQFIYFQF